MIILTNVIFWIWEYAKSSQTVGNMSSQILNKLPD